jgi:hypothetical protein
MARGTARLPALPLAWRMLGGVVVLFAIAISACSPDAGPASPGSTSASAYTSSEVPFASGTASIAVDGAERGAFDFSELHTTAIPGRPGAVYTFASANAEMVIELPTGAAKASLTSVRVQSYFIGDCSVPLVRTDTMIRGEIDCSLTYTEDVTKTISVKGAFSLPT